jgi:hypothetical protein
MTEFNLNSKIKELQENHKIIKSAKIITDFDQNNYPVLEVMVKPHEFYRDLLEMSHDISRIGCILIDEQKDVEIDTIPGVTTVDIYYFKKC